MTRRQGILLLNYILVITVILKESRTPHKIFPYVLRLILVPVFGWIGYYFLAYDRKKRRGRGKKAPHYNAFFEYCRRFEIPSYTLPDGYEKPVTLLHAYNNGTVLPATSLTVLKNGSEKFPVLLEDIKNARQCIHIEYFIREESAIEQQITELLMLKVQEGLEVRLLLDGFGSNSYAQKARVLQQKGITVAFFFPVKREFLARANYRDHRKIVVIDQEIAYTGGMNVSDRYRPEAVGSSKLRRDTHLRIGGSAANLLHAEFCTNRFVATGEALHVGEKYFSAPSYSEGDRLMALASSTPASRYPVCMDCLIAAFDQAKERILITTPYLVPSEEIIKSLCIAAAIGVKVQILVPSKSDVPLLQRVLYSYAEILLEGGVEIYLYQEGMLHAKTIVVDNEIAMIGSVNLDIRSFYINAEVLALCYDRETVKVLAGHFDEDLQHSNQLTLSGVKKRPRYRRFGYSVCRLLSPLV